MIYLTYVEACMSVHRDLFI